MASGPGATGRGRLLEAKTDRRPAYPGKIGNAYWLDQGVRQIEHRAMGFNRRKMEDQRRQAAEKEAAARRATDAPNRGLERAAGQAHADAVLADDRRRCHGRLLVFMRPLPGLPHYERDRSAHARSPSRRGRDKPHSVVVVSFVPAERAVCRARAAIADKHRR